MINKQKIIIQRKIVYKKFVMLCWAFLLSSCDLYMGGITNTDVKMDCPPVSIVPEASSITRYIKGNKRSVLDVDFTGLITGIKGNCSYDLNYETGVNTVEINVITKFKMERGAANNSHQADFQYFVSIINSEGKILGKEVFDFSAKFSKERSWAKNKDSPVKLIVPFGDERGDKSFTVFVGFQLSKEELEFNRNEGKLK